MYKGKATCKILKDIRREIAENNNIEYVTSDCKYQGDCLGTCPKCEEEVRYLEAELAKRRQLGYAPAILGISLGIATTFSACHAPNGQTSKTSPAEDTGRKIEETVRNDKPAKADSTKKNSKSYDEINRCITVGEAIPVHGGITPTYQPIPLDSPYHSDIEIIDDTTGDN